MAEATQSQTAAVEHHECDASDSLIRARRALELTFGEQPGNWSFRLWDGGLVHIGPQPAESILAFKTKETFKQLLRKADLLAFGEAYVNGEIDIEGDIFDLMKRANGLNLDDVSLLTKIKVWSLIRKL